MDGGQRLAGPNTFAGLYRDDRPRLGRRPVNAARSPRPPRRQSGPCNRSRTVYSSASRSPAARNEVTNSGIGIVGVADALFEPPAAVLVERGKLVHRQSGIPIHSATHRPRCGRRSGRAARRVLG